MEYDLSNKMQRINRIRLEFKDRWLRNHILIGIRINRIRLEFKVNCPEAVLPKKNVLIESDWNLKSVINKGG